MAFYQRNSQRGVLSFSTLLLFFLWFCYPTASNTWIALSILFILTILNPQIFQNLKSKYFLKFNIHIALFCVVIFASWYISKSYIAQYTLPTVPTTKLVRVLFISISLFISILFLQYHAKKGRGEYILGNLIKIFFVYTVLIDLQSLTVSARAIEEQIYWAGNKFSLTYSNLWLAFLYFLKNPDLRGQKRTVYYSMLVVTLFISIHSDCSTLVIATFVMFLLTWLRDSKLSKVLCQPSFFIISIVLSASLMVFFSAVVFQIPFFNYVLVKILGESEDMTGRLLLYERLTTILLDHPLWGYGIRNVASIIEPLIPTIKNSQNGVLQLYLEMGIMGVVTYFAYLIRIVLHAQGRKMLYPVIVLLYMYLVIGLVEIPFTPTALFLASFIFLKQEFYERTHYCRL